VSFEVSPLQRDAARLVAEMDQDRGREPSRRIKAIANAKPRARRGAPDGASGRSGIARSGEGSGS